MDGRERLRAYLEQRRELGESEFVLDSMSVDEALARSTSFDRQRLQGRRRLLVRSSRPARWRLPRRPTLLGQLCSETHGLLHLPMLRIGSRKCTRIAERT